MKKSFYLALLGLSLSTPVLAAPQHDFDNALQALQQGDMNSAYHYLSQVVEASPNATTPKLYLAQTAQQMERWQEAAELYSDVLRQRPSEIKAHLGLGISAYHLQSYSQARTSLKRVLAQTNSKSHDSKATAHYYLGLTEMVQGNHKLSATHLNTSKSLNPQYTQLVLATLTQNANQQSVPYSRNDNRILPNHVIAQLNLPSRLTTHLSLGMEHDDNLTVVEADRQSDKSDHAVTLEAELEYILGNWQDWSWSSGYDLYQSHYSTFDEFDLTSHGVWIAAERSLETWDVNGQYRYSHSSIDHDKLYSSHSFRPGIGRQWGSQFYTSGYVDYQRRDFEDDLRDGNLIQMGGDIIWFPDSRSSYAVVSLGLDHDDTDGDEFIYSGVRLAAAWNFPLRIKNHTIKNSLSVNWEDRDYDKVTPAIGTKRDDQRTSMKLSSEYKIRRDWVLKASYEYVDNESNLDSLNYHQNLFSLSTGLSF